MGRFKTVEIKGLLIEDFGEMFVESFNDAMKSSGLSEEEALKKLAPKFKELLSSYEDIVSTLYLDQHKIKLDRFLTANFRSQKKIANLHKDSFVAFILYINGCFVCYQKIIGRINRKRIDSTLKTNVALYGLIIRRADQIVSQLLNGYIDGAMVIWRSLYENAIILLLLAQENDNKLADKYVQHSLRNSRKKVQSYNTHYKELRFAPLPPSNEKKLQSEVLKMEARHGKEFLDNEYGWADNLFPGKQKASLRFLEDRVDMSRFRPYYLLCSEHLHPSYNSFKNYMEGKRIILPRILKQEFELDSFIDPMQFTVSILHEINDYVLYEFSIEEEYNVNVLLMEKIFEKQQQTFSNPKKKKRKKRSGTIRQQ